MTVYFANSGLIDLDVIRVMGVSVKTNDSPIGYFGTGLKFAIATLLRTDHVVVLHRGGEIYRFKAQEAQIRGKTVKRVFMNDEPLAFTTELGRNWEVWHAYRELHSNMLDEGGRVSDSYLEDDTVFEVVGSAITLEYHNRDKIFLSTKPIAAVPNYLEVHPGASQTIFYRGVKAGQLPSPGAFTYNLLCDMELTEDRNLKSMWTVEWRLASLLPKLDHKGVHVELLSKGDNYDKGLDWTICHTPAPEFVEAARSIYSDMNCSPSARRVVEREMQSAGEFETLTLLPSPNRLVEHAFAALEKLNCTLERDEVQFVQSLGSGIWGMYHREKDTIYIAATTIDHGLETLVATLYEEWLHKHHHLTDESRSMQNFLIQRLAALALAN